MQEIHYKRSPSHPPISWNMQESTRMTFGLGWYRLLQKDSFWWDWAARPRRSTGLQSTWLPTTTTPFWIQPTWHINLALSSKSSKSGTHSSMKSTKERGHSPIRSFGIRLKTPTKKQDLSYQMGPRKASSTCCTLTTSNISIRLSSTSSNLFATTYTILANSAVPME